jgi:iron complex transport system substrate-binding protein
MSRSPRIVSLLPAATEMTCGAGLRNSLVGVSHECNWPSGVEGLPRLTRSRVDSSADSGAIDEQVKALFAAGEPLYEVDVAQLVALKPTLIVTQSQCDVCAVSYASVAKAVATTPALAGCKLVALNPRTLGEVIDDVERIGAATGALDSARAFADSLRCRVAAIAALAAGRTGRRPRVLVIEWIEPLMIAGNWTPELVALAGGAYGLASAGSHSPYVTWQAVVDFAPEVLFVAPCGFNLERSEREARRLADLPHWRDLPAVRDGHVHIVDGDAYFNRPGPRLVDSLELLSNRLAQAPAGP